jgi:tetratricopeptide (TPR) repeat protein
MTIPQVYQRAVELHQSGRLAEAQALYQQVLAQQPAHADAWHMLAGLAHQSGNQSIALECVQRAIGCNPSAAVYHASDGVILAAIGQSDDAIAAYRQAVLLQPNLAGAHANLANLLKDKGQGAQAIEHYRLALTHRPDHPPTLHNLALTLKQEGILDDAIAHFRRAAELQPDLIDSRLQLSECLKDAGRLDESIAETCRVLALKPDSAPAHNSLGLALQESQRLDEAITAFRHAIALDPKFAAGYTNLGGALERKRESSEAVDVLRRAVELEADSPAAHLNLANSLLSLGQLDEARKEYETAIALRPNFPEALTSLGKLHSETGDFDAAIQCYQRALSIQPDFHKATLNWSILLLLRSDFERGLPMYESRRRIKSLGADRGLGGRKWNGENLEGRSILLHWEQGMGDTIHLVRYARILKSRGASVSLLCQPPLKRLLSGQCDLEIVVGQGEPLPPYDFYCPLPSLPLLVGMTLANIPSDVPYLMAEAPLVEHWKATLAQQPAGPRVGLVWAGSPQHQNDRNRSIALADLTPLKAAGNVNFYSLQKGPAAEQAKATPQLEMVDWTAQLADWADTAALISSLDLVITVDTAVAHLAGALGKPVWVLLAFLPDWRWMLNREDSPWYPTMQLFRQKTRGDWRVPIEKVAAQLAELGT